MSAEVLATAESVAFYTSCDIRNTFARMPALQTEWMKSSSSSVNSISTADREERPTAPGLGEHVQCELLVVCLLDHDLRHRFFPCEAAASSAEQRSALIPGTAFEHSFCRPAS